MMAKVICASQPNLRAVVAILLAFSKKNSTRQLGFLCLAFLLVPRLQAQLRIENPRHLEVPEERAQLIVNSAAQVVAEEFHVQDVHAIEFPITLVMGSPDDYYEEDANTKTYAVHLRTWREREFTASVIQLTVHQLVTVEKRDKMLARILTRVNRVSPVDVSELPGKQGKGSQGQ